MKFYGLPHNGPRLFTLHVTLLHVDEGTQVLSCYGPENGKYHDEKVDGKKLKRTKDKEQ